MTDTNEPSAATAAQTPDDTDEDRCHLDDVADGCGCAEIWEHLADQRTTE